MCDLGFFKCYLTFFSCTRGQYSYIMYNNIHVCVGCFIRFIRFICTWYQLIHSSVVRISCGKEKMVPGLYFSLKSPVASYVVLQISFGSVQNRQRILSLISHMPFFKDLLCFFSASHDGFKCIPYIFDTFQVIKIVAPESI